MGLNHGPPHRSPRPLQRAGGPTRRLTRWLLAALFAVAIIAAVDGVQLQRLAALNAETAGGRPVMPAALRPLPDRPEWLFLQASDSAAQGDDAAAIDGFRRLQGDTAIGQAARYNTANALLRQAVRLRAAQQPGAAIPLLELSKETLREVLRHDPAHWPARYNLERAQRLLPDPEPADDTPPEPPSQAERAATTMRGYAPGLP